MLKITVEDCPLDILYSLQNGPHIYIFCPNLPNWANPAYPKQVVCMHLWYRMTQEIRRSKKKRIQFLDSSLSYRFKILKMVLLLVVGDILIKNMSAPSQCLPLLNKYLERCAIIVLYQILEHLKLQYSYSLSHIRPVCM